MNSSEEKDKARANILDKIGHLGEIPSLQAFIIEISNKFVKISATGTSIISMDEKQSIASCLSGQFDKETTVLLQQINNIKLPAINFEEVRNIIGDSQSIYDIDKISENSYRLAYNELHRHLYLLLDIELKSILNLRYGHNNKRCPINGDVVRWCVDSAIGGRDLAE
jgi:hypothetical protein